MLSATLRIDAAPMPAALLPPRCRRFFARYAAFDGCRCRRYYFATLLCTAMVRITVTALQPLMLAILMPPFDYYDGHDAC